MISLRGQRVIVYKNSEHLELDYEGSVFSVDNGKITVIKDSGELTFPATMCIRIQVDEKLKKLFNLK